MVRVVRMESFGAVAYEDGDGLNFLGQFGRGLYVRSPREVLRLKGEALRVVDAGAGGAGYLSAPISLEVEVTLSCPLRCLHCYSNAGESNSVLPRELFLKLVDEASEMGVFALDVIGGEPLTRRDLPELLSYAHRKDLSTTLNTNAVLAKRDVVRGLRGSGLRKVFVSLDAHVAEVHDEIRGVRGAFKRTMEGLKGFLAEDFDVTLGYTVTKLNYQVFEDYLRFASSMGVNKVHVMRFVPVGRGEGHRGRLELREDQLLSFLTQARSIAKGPMEVSFDCSFGIFNAALPLEASATCPAGTVMGAILVDGTAVPCGHFRYDSRFYAGNINRSCLKEVWSESRVYDAFRRRVAECEACEALSTCRGGCRAFAMLRGNGSRDPLACSYFLGKRHG